MDTPAMDSLQLHVRERKPQWESQFQIALPVYCDLVFEFIFPLALTF